MTEEEIAARFSGKVAETESTGRGRMTMKRSGGGVTEAIGGFAQAVGDDIVYGIQSIPHLPAAIMPTGKKGFIGAFDEEADPDEQAHRRRALADAALVLTGFGFGKLAAVVANPAAANEAGLILRGVLGKARADKLASPFGKAMLEVAERTPGLKAALGAPGRAAFTVGALENVVFQALAHDPSQPNNVFVDAAVGGSLGLGAQRLFARVLGHSKEGKAAARAIEQLEAEDAARRAAGKYDSHSELMDDLERQATARVEHEAARNAEAKESASQLESFLGLSEGDISAPSPPSRPPTPKPYWQVMDEMMGSPDAPHPAQAYFDLLDEGGAGDVTRAEMAAEEMGLEGPNAPPSKPYVRRERGTRVNYGGPGDWRWDMEHGQSEANWAQLQDEVIEAAGTQASTLNAARAAQQRLRQAQLANGDTEWVDDFIRRTAAIVNGERKSVLDVVRADYPAPGQSTVKSTVFAEVARHPALVGTANKGFRLEVASRIVGRPVTTFSSLTRAEGEKIVNTLRALRNEPPVEFPKRSVIAGVKLSRNRGMAAVEFPDSDHAELYAAARRRGGMGEMDAETTARIVEITGMPPEAVDVAAQMYRGFVDDTVELLGVGRHEMPTFHEFLDKYPGSQSFKRNQVLAAVTERVSARDAQKAAAAGRRVRGAGTTAQPKTQADVVEAARGPEKKAARGSARNTAEASAEAAARVASGDSEVVPPTPKAEVAAPAAAKEGTPRVGRAAGAAFSNGTRPLPESVGEYVATTRKVAQRPYRKVVVRRTKDYYEVDKKTGKKRLVARAGSVRLDKNGKPVTKWIDNKTGQVVDESVVKKKGNKPTGKVEAVAGRQWKNLGRKPWEPAAKEPGSAKRTVDITDEEMAELERAINATGQDVSEFVEPAVPGKLRRVKDARRELSDLEMPPEEPTAPGAVKIPGVGPKEQYFRSKFEPVIQELERRATALRDELKQRHSVLYDRVKRLEDARFDQQAALERAAAPYRRRRELPPQNPAAEARMKRLYDATERTKKRIAAIESEAGLPKVNSALASMKRELNAALERGGTRRATPIKTQYYKVNWRATNAAGDEVIGEIPLELKHKIPAKDDKGKFILNEKGKPTYVEEHIIGGLKVKAKHLGNGRYKIMAVNTGFLPTAEAAVRYSKTDRKKWAIGFDALHGMLADLHFNHGANVIEFPPNHPVKYAMELMLDSNGRTGLATRVKFSEVAKQLKELTARYRAALGSGDEMLIRRLGEELLGVRGTFASMQARALTAGRGVLIKQREGLYVFSPNASFPIARTAAVSRIPKVGSDYIGEMQARILMYESNRGIDPVTGLPKSKNLEIERLKTRLSKEQTKAFRTGDFTVMRELETKLENLLSDNPNIDIEALAKEIEGPATPELEPYMLSGEDANALLTGAPVGKPGQVVKTSQSLSENPKELERLRAEAAELKAKMGQSLEEDLAEDIVPEGTPPPPDMPESTLEEDLAGDIVATGEATAPAKKAPAGKVIGAATPEQKAKFEAERKVAAKEMGLSSLEEDLADDIVSGKKMVDEVVEDIDAEVADVMDDGDNTVLPSTADAIEEVVKKQPKVAKPKAGLGVAGPKEALSPDVPGAENAPPLHSDPAWRKGKSLAVKLVDGTVVYFEPGEVVGRGRLAGTPITNHAMAIQAFLAKNPKLKVGDIREVGFGQRTPTLSPSGAAVGSSIKYIPSYRLPGGEVSRKAAPFVKADLKTNADKLMEKWTPIQMFLSKRSVSLSSSGINDEMLSSIVKLQEQADELMKAYETAGLTPPRNIVAMYNRTSKIMNNQRSRVPAVVARVEEAKKVVRPPVEAMPTPTPIKLTVASSQRVESVKSPADALTAIRQINDEIMAVMEQARAQGMNSIDAVSAQDIERAMAETHQIFLKVTGKGSLKDISHLDKTLFQVSHDVRNAISFLSMTWQQKVKRLDEAMPGHGQKLKDSLGPALRAFFDTTV